MAIHATREGLPSADVISQVLYFICRPPDDDDGELADGHKYAVRLRSTSRLWSLAFGQFLELWVVPRGTQLDGAGRAVWTPHENRPELLLVLLHLNDGLTNRLTRSLLYGLSLRSLPRAVVRGQLPPRAGLVALRQLALSGPGPSSKGFHTLLGWFPNLTSLSLTAAGLDTSDMLRLPATMEELSLPRGFPSATDDAMQRLSKHFSHLRTVKLPWSRKMSLASAQYLLRLTTLRTVSISAARLGLHHSLVALKGLIGTAARMKQLVRELDLSDNGLQSLPESLGELTALEHLDASINRLVVLPRSFEQLTALKRINLGANQLTALPESIGGLSALRELHLNGNQLRSLPESLGALAALEDLQLGQNQLVSLPESIRGLVQLRELQLAGNNLASLPRSLGRLVGLRELGLDRNQLALFPPEAEGLKSLQSLHLASNLHFLLSHCFPMRSSVQWGHTPGTLKPSKTHFNTSLTLPQHLRPSQSTTLIAQPASQASTRCKPDPRNGLLAHSAGRLAAV